VLAWNRRFRSTNERSESRSAPTDRLSAPGRGIATGQQQVLLAERVVQAITLRPGSRDLAL